ncbi:unnamed protein product [Sphagnum troendelagicum]|uniref:Uncharacterized protein n=1 Tax=Sphagnum troendelagicum TaxID=128251 RepID=A0ABP0TK72_9BRYO
MAYTISHVGRLRLFACCRKGLFSDAIELRPGRDLQNCMFNFIIFSFPLPLPLEGLVALIFSLPSGLLLFMLAVCTFGPSGVVSMKEHVFLFAFTLLPRSATVDDIGSFAEFAE